MEVYGTITQKVTINPLSVMKQLYESELHWRHWVFEEDGKFYEGWEDHRFEDQKEISKERYDYIRALQLVISKLEKDGEI